MNYILKPAVTLFITAVITISVVSYAYNLTLEPIQRQIRRTQEAAMGAVLPQASDFRQMPFDKTGSITGIFEGLAEGQVIGFVVALSPGGYGGNIDMMVGISIPDEKITGMRILRHSETPGLGALATREFFYRRFDNRPLVPLGVARSSPGENDILAITSSTITTRAITNAVNEAIKWYQDAQYRAGPGGGR